MSKAALPARRFPHRIAGAEEGTTHRAVGRCQFAAFEQQDAPAAETGEMIGDRDADHATAHDNDIEFFHGVGRAL